jgi:hypothetical protein
LVSFSKITEVANIFGPLYSIVKFTYALFLKKMGRAIFWGFFSQTHLVTLVASVTDGLKGHLIGKFSALASNYRSPLVSGTGPNFIGSKIRLMYTYQYLGTGLNWRMFREGPLKEC